MKKTEAFEYFLFKLNQWFNEKNIGAVDNDLSVLKSLKLLFFVSVVKADKNSTNTLLDNVFNNFVAMPYGHVESNIYSSIKEGLPNVVLNNKKLVISETFSEDVIDENDKILIDDSIKELQSINSNLINLSSFDLVDLSHSWYSWQSYYDKAKKAKSYSMKIPIHVIKNEEKIFTL